LRARIQRALAARTSLAAIQRDVRRDEFRLQVLLRPTPLNPATINYPLGAAGVRFSGREDNEKGNQSIKRILYYPE
jgi:hypothetical protein